MRKGIGCITFIVLVNVAFLCLADPTKEPAYASEKPLYVRVAVSEDASKVLSVVFDESKGTGEGYDVLYADADLSGQLDKARKLEATTFKCPSGVHFYFPPIELNAVYNKRAVGISDPCQVILTYEKHSSKTSTTARLLRTSSAATTTEDFFLLTSVRLGDGSTEQEYSFNQNIRPSQSLSNPPVWSFPRNPKVAVTTKPDPQKKGNWGIGLDLADSEGQKQVSRSGEAQGGGCGCAATQARFQSSPPINAHVEIKTPDGKLIHKGDATLDKFTFG